MAGQAGVTGVTGETGTTGATGTEVETVSGDGIYINPTILLWVVKNDVFKYPFFKEFLWPSV